MRSVPFGVTDALSSISNEVGVDVWSLIKEEERKSSGFDFIELWTLW